MKTPGIVWGFLALSALGGWVHADSMAPPSSYTTVTPNGEYVFVMLGPVPPDADAAPWMEERAEEIRMIRRTYPQSGLYRNDGSTNPLWTVEWYAYSVEPCSDGVHLVRPGPWASDPQQEAVAFFANGELLRSYRIDQLVDVPRLLPRSVSHFSWRSKVSLDDEAKRYRIRTLHGEIYGFDVTTGRMEYSFRTPRWIAVLVIPGTVIVLRWLWRRRKRKKP